MGKFIFIVIASLVTSATWSGPAAAINARQASPGSEAVMILSPTTAAAYRSARVEVFPSARGAKLFTALPGASPANKPNKPASPRQG